MDRPISISHTIAGLVLLRSPHANDGMKQYECGHTQPLLRAGRDHGKTSVSKPKGLRQILVIIMKHKYITIITVKKT